jgi:hypothetical protein
VMPRECTQQPETARPTMGRSRLTLFLRSQALALNGGIRIKPFDLFFCCCLPQKKEESPFLLPLIFLRPRSRHPTPPRAAV